MKISYTFTSGRLEAVFKISNHIQYGEKNDTAKEKEIIEKFRADVSSGKSHEDTELFKALSSVDEKIVINRFTRVLKENTGSKNDPFSFNEYRAGVYHELDDYKLAIRFSEAKELLNKKHLEKTGMNITVRDICAMSGHNPTNIKNSINHKRGIVLGMLEAIEKLAKDY
ncbi:hypothetical protein [Acinetobacter beijerinckii]|uniref:Uncharacterized protein n=1 Tax=Acinetobacter beijerinckii CIP 110307 TaxID=1217648 RepID=N9F6N0_9GAMM|nr:hypothetical protein [Acinetobacter beijerinckii]ENW02970.1 hypothetical protein F933_03376 [Acinetobacter beijerinckii CIP 110307]